MDYWAFPYTDAGANAYETGNAADSVDDRFLLRRVRLEISGNIPDNMLYRMQVDFADPNAPNIKDVYLGWEELPVLQTVLFGNQKRPYGLDSINSTRFNIFLERPAMVDAFNTNYRRFGICAYGVTEDLAYNWRYGVFMSQDLQGLGIAQATPIAESYQGEFDARLANTIWYDEASDGRGFAHWAVSGVAANTDGNAGAASTARFRTRPEARTTGNWADTGVILNATSYQMVGVETLINAGPVQFVAEYLHTSVQRTGMPDLSFHGEYAFVSYFLTGESMTWDRNTGQLGRTTPLENFFLVNTCDGGVGGGWGAWQLAARYDHLDLTDDNIQGGIMDSCTLSLVWHWTPYSKLQFNYILGEIDQHRPIDGQTSARYQIIGARFACDF
jgi:phosphate-selective porin OprO/OprP